MKRNEAKLKLEWVNTDRATVYDNIDKIYNYNEIKINKAIEKLELMREYCNNVIHPSCDYNIYTDMIDFIDSTINSLEK